MKKYKLAVKYDMVEIDGDYILTPQNDYINQSTNAIILNKTGYEMFRALIDCTDTKVIIDELARKYSVDKSIIESDLKDIIDELKEKALIVEI